MPLQAPVRDTLRDLPAIADPAARDTEEPWPAGRFAQRVRRTWNTVTGADIRDAGDDLDRLAAIIQEKTGEDAAKARQRLDAFVRAERAGEPQEDPLLRPGAGLPSVDHEPPR